MRGARGGHSSQPLLVALAHHLSKCDEVAQIVEPPPRFDERFAANTAIATAAAAIQQSCCALRRKVEACKLDVKQPIKRHQELLVDGGHAELKVARGGRKAREDVAMLREEGGKRRFPIVSSEVGIENLAGEALEAGGECVAQLLQLLFVLEPHRLRFGRVGKARGGAHLLSSKTSSFCFNL